MKKDSNRGLLIPWLRTALNKQLYKGLRWKDREREIFYIHWTHKSAEQWSKEDLEPFEAWAAHKGKLHGKNEKQLKATFRCALNSKKELTEIYRDRSRRYWQFVDPETADKSHLIKKKRKANSAISSVASSEKVECTVINGLPSVRISSSSEDELSRSTKLPAFESFCSFASLTPPHQANEILSIPKKESEFSEKETSRKERYRLNSDFDDSVTPITSPNSVRNLYASSSSSFGSSEEYRVNYTPPPDHSRLTPPQKSCRDSSRNSFHQSSDTDVYQPNCWSTPQAHHDFSLSQFFLNDFIEMYKSTNQELDKNYYNNNNNKMDFLEMDQHVPVMDISHNYQTHHRNEHHNLTNKSDFPNDQLEQMKLDDDYLLIGEVDEEAREKIFTIIQELDRPATETNINQHQNLV